MMSNDGEAAAASSNDASLRLAENRKYCLAKRVLRHRRGDNVAAWRQASAPYRAYR